MNVGYARVSTSSQNLENQIDQLKSAGCVKRYFQKKDQERMNQIASNLIL